MDFKVRAGFPILRLGHDNVNDHRAAAIDLQAEKAARPAAPCATYCYHAIVVAGANAFREDRFIINILYVI